MSVLPPGLFSTTAGCPHASWNLAASVRPSVSLNPPGGYGTTIRIGFDGYVCANASEAARKTVIPATTRVIPAKAGTQFPRSNIPRPLDHRMRREESLVHLHADPRLLQRPHRAVL